MYALRERRVHVTQEDFEMAVAKVSTGGEAMGGSRWVPPRTRSCQWGTNCPGQHLLGAAKLEEAQLWGQRTLLTVLSPSSEAVSDTEEAGDGGRAWQELEAAVPPPRRAESWCWGWFWGLLTPKLGAQARTQLSLPPHPGDAEGQREEHVHQEAVEVTVRLGLLLGPRCLQ